MSYRAGFLGLIGQPNAGKSTLMNFLVDEKVSIVSNKPQTTRRRILGIWNSDAGQVVFVDAPGIIKADKGLNGFLAKEAEDVIAQSDALLAVISVDEKSAEDAEKVIDMVSQSGKPWLGVITKTDLKDKDHRVLILKDLIEKKKGKALQVSSIGKHADEDREALLIDILNLMPECPAPLYDVELFTPESVKNMAAEIIREKCFEFLHHEIPYSLAVRIIKFDENASPVPRISFDLVVSKENHKAIVIGKKGETIKKIGSEARKEIEKLMGEKVFLELNVSCREDWFANKNIMKELGYIINEEK